MAERVLRDHSQPCEHGFTGYHGAFQGDGESSCPGGREVTIDNEWIEQILGELCRDWSRSTLSQWSASIPSSMLVYRIRRSDG